MTGALLRRSLTPSDLAAWLTATPGADHGSHPLGRRPRFDPLTWNRIVHPPRLPAPQLMARALRAPTRVHALTMASTLAGDGSRTLLPHLETIGRDVMRSEVPDVVQASFLEAGARIASAEYQSIRWLSNRAQHRAPAVMVPGGA